MKFKIATTVHGADIGLGRIGCFMQQEEARELTRYASSIELGRPSLLALLVQRALIKDQTMEGISTLKIVNVDGRVRVTTKSVSTDLKSAFTAFVAAGKTSEDDAAAAIFRKELEERWFASLFMKA